MGRNTKFARTASQDDLAQADAACMSAEEENLVATTTATTATTTTSVNTTASAATAGTSSSVTTRGRKAALKISLASSHSGTSAATTTTTCTTTTTVDCTTGAVSAAAVPSGPAKRAPRVTPDNTPPELPATAHDVTDVASLARVVTLLSAVIVKAVHDGKSVTAVNKRRIACAAEEIRRAAHALTRASPAEPPQHTNDQPATTDVTGLDGVKKELVACVRAEISKLKAELVGARPSRPPPDAAAAFTSRSYAQALGSEPARRPATATAYSTATPPAPRVSKPAIIVAPKAQVTSRQQAIEAFRRSISFRESNYAPVRVQPVSQHKLRVEFDTDQQRDDALLRIGDASEVTAEPARTLKPMLLLKGINKDTPISELVDIVRRQNDCTGGELALKFERKNRNENLYSAVLVASSDVWRKLVGLGRVCVDHQRVHVERFSPFVQCFACLQFGHVRKNCNASAPKPCACCASTAHQEPDCPSKLDKNISFKCYNCTNRNIKFNNNDPTNHKATSGFCSVARAMRARVETRVDYGLP